MSAIHWRIRELQKPMRAECHATLDVLVNLISRANIRMRCWPGMDRIADETGWAISVVTDAKHWLMKARAVVLVPYKKRLGEELTLPPRQHVYQLTGVMQIGDGPLVPYLFLSPEAEAAIGAEVSQIEISDSEISDSEVSFPETEGIPSSEDSSNIQGKDNIVAGATKSPSKKKREYPQDALFNAIAFHFFGASTTESRKLSGKDVAWIMNGNPKMDCDGLMAYERGRSGQEPSKDDLAALIPAFRTWLRQEHNITEIRDCRKWIRRWDEWRNRLIFPQVSDPWVDDPDHPGGQIRQSDLNRRRGQRNDSTR